MLAVRSALLSAFLVGVAFAGNAADTYRQLVQQPTPPAINHATPWAALAPKLNFTGVPDGAPVPAWWAGSGIRPSAM